MDKTIDKTIGNYGNFEAAQGFPLDCGTLEYIKENQAMAEILGNALGDKVILQGCERVNGQGRTEGYVFLRTNDFPNGEVLRFEGHPTTFDYVHIKTTGMNVSASGNNYVGAYTTRKLVEGSGGEEFKWSDFADVSSTGCNLRDLIDKVNNAEEKIKNVITEPVGVIKMWPTNNPPTNYLICDGSTFVEKDYPELAEVLGCNTLPDLRGRFVVGYNKNDTTDFGEIGNTGGSKGHQLKVNELPQHKHELKDYYDAEQYNFVKDGGNLAHSVDYIEKISINGYKYGNSLPDINKDGGTIGIDWDNDGMFYHKHETEDNDTTGSMHGQEFKTLPPYYVLTYIIKCK